MTNELDGEILQWLSIAKGDVQGHVFHGNQYASWGGGSAPAPASTGGHHDEAVNYLRKLQETAAKELANKIDGDRTKSVEQHLDEAREQVKALRQNAHKEAMFDNHDTAKGLKDEAAALSGAIEQLSKQLGIQKSVGEIQNWIAIAKGDTPGHPFRGNQYQEIAAEHVDEHQQAGDAHMKQAESLARAAGQQLQMDGDPKLAHTTLDKANAHEAAAHAHYDAALAWTTVRYSHPDDVDVANKAQALSTKAYEMTGSVNKSVGGEILPEADGQPLEFYELEKARRNENDDEARDEEDEEDEDADNHLFGMYDRD